MVRRQSQRSCWASIHETRREVWQTLRTLSGKEAAGLLTPLQRQDGAGATAASSPPTKPSTMPFAAASSKLFHTADGAPAMTSAAAPRAAAVQSPEAGR